MANLKKLFIDICRGYSKYKLEDSFVFVKHIGHFDQIDIDDQYDVFIDEAKKRGLFTLDEQLVYLEKELLWTKKNQGEVDEIKSYLDNLKLTKNQLALKRQIDQINVQIKEAEEKYYNLLNNKSKLIGMTCENYANKKIELFYIKKLFYSNWESQVKLLTDDNINDIDSDYIDKLLLLYSNFINDFSFDNIKKISVSSSFTSLFYLSDNLDSFFGGPLCQLTYYQSNLLSYGNYYKNMLKNNDVPNDLLENPDKLEEYVRKTRNMKEMIEKSGAKRIGIVGASNEEIKELGGSNEGFLKND